MKMFGMCLNWKVMAGLAAVGVGLFLFASPTTAAAALPFLLAAICPLSMVFMMRGMGNMHSNAQAGMVSKTSATQSACCTPNNTKLTREEQVAALQQQLREMQGQQERLSAQLAQLEAPEPIMDTPPVLAVKTSH